MHVRRRYRIALPGLLFLALVIVVGVAAGSRAGNLLVWVFSAMVAWILVSGVVSGAMLMGVRVRRLEPGAGSVGRPLVIRYEVTNANWLWPIVDLRIEESRLDAARAGQRRDGALHKLKVGLGRHAGNSSRAAGTTGRTNGAVPDNERLPPGC